MLCFRKIFQLYTRYQCLHKISKNKRGENITVMIHALLTVKELIVHVACEKEMAFLWYEGLHREKIFISLT